MTFILTLAFDMKGDYQIKLKPETDSPTGIDILFSVQ